MLTNNDRVKWIKSLWLEQNLGMQCERNVLSFFIMLQNTSPNLVKFNNYSGDPYQRVASIVMQQD